MSYDTILKLNELTVDASEKLVIRPYQHGEIDVHQHLFFELVYVVDGTAKHTLNGETTIIQKGDYFIIDLKSSHRYSECHNLSLINCLFLPEVMDETLKDCQSFDQFIHRSLIRSYKLNSSQTPVNQIFHDYDHVIFQLLTKIQAEYQAKQFGYTTVFQSLIIEILILTIRQVIGEMPPSSPSVIVSNMIHYLQQHYMKPHLLQDFCDDYHFSPPYISRKFKEETGLTVMDYLQNIRILKSCELLLGTDKKISEIAYLVGYQDMKYYQTLFKKTISISPRAYRQQHTK